MGKLPAVVRAYVAHLRWDLLPIYVGLAGISMWLGAVTVLLLSQAGVPSAETTTIIRLTLVLGVTFGVLLPFVPPAIRIAVTSPATTEVRTDD